MNTVVKSVKLTDKEKEELLKSVLGKDYHTAGNNLPVLKKVIDLVSNTSDIATFAELIPALNTILAKSRLLAFVSSGAAVLSILLFPVGAMISVINASQVSVKMYSYRAIAYAITAWAFNKPIPTSSPRIMSNSRSGNIVSSQSKMLDKKNAWKKASDSAVREMNNICLTYKVKKEFLQVLLRALGDNNEQKLCELILKGYEKQFSEFSVKAVWKSNYSIKFPQ